MTSWTLEIAKHDFKIGYLESFRIERADGGWRISLKGGSADGFLVDARWKKPRIFKTVESAIGTLEQIGFKVEFLH
jgi:hypothetical protein